MIDMHGHERNVERTIRLWIAQQERNRRKAGQQGRAKARGGAPIERGRRAIDVRQREHWQ
jgi:hypothetical protein